MLDEWSGAREMADSGHRQEERQTDASDGASAGHGRKATAGGLIWSHLCEELVNLHEQR